MCKLIIIPHVPEGRSKQAWRLAKAVTGPMTASDHDGFGYSAITRGDELLTERWLLPADAWQRNLRSEFAGLEPILEGTVTEHTYTHQGPAIGPKLPAIKAIMLHARWSTSGGGIENTHPFVLEDKDGPWAALIHNGVVAKDGLRFEQSTCDSEGILNAMRDENALYVPENLQDALDRIYGYYALGVMVHTYEGWAVDVIKDGTAHLTALYVAELDAVVFATSPDHVTAACKQLKWRRPARAKLRDNVRVRFDATTGAALVTDTFEPKGWARTKEALSHASGNYSHYGRGWGDDEPSEDMENEWQKAKKRLGLRAKGENELQPWVCGVCAQIWSTRETAEACQHAETESYMCDACDIVWGTREAAQKCSHGGAGKFDVTPVKANVYIGEAADVQAALAKMDLRSKAKQSDPLVIDAKGCVTMPDGTILELSDKGE